MKYALMFALALPAGAAFAAEELPAALAAPRVVAASPLDQFASEPSVREVQANQVALRTGEDLSFANNDADVLPRGGAEDTALQLGAPELGARVRIEGRHVTIGADDERCRHVRIP